MNEYLKTLNEALIDRRKKLFQAVTSLTLVIGEIVANEEVQPHDAKLAADLELWASVDLAWLRAKEKEMQQAPTKDDA